MVFNKGEVLFIDWENIVDDGYGGILGSGGEQSVLVKEDFDVKGQ